MQDPGFTHQRPSQRPLSLEAMVPQRGRHGTRAQAAGGCTSPGHRWAPAAAKARSGSPRRSRPRWRLFTQAAGERFPPFLPPQPSLPETRGLAPRSIPADSGTCAQALTDLPAAALPGLGSKSAAPKPAEPVKRSCAGARSRLAKSRGDQWGVSGDAGSWVLCLRTSWQETPQRYF